MYGSSRARDRERDLDASRKFLLVRTVLSTNSREPACTLVRTLVLLPAGTIYRGTQKHYSLVKVLFALYHNMRYNASMMKKKTSIRYSAEAKDLLEKLAKKMGISQSAVLELAIRALAKQEGIA